MSNLTLPTDVDKRFLLDPYVQWAQGEQIPIYEDFGIDFLTIETQRWDRFDAHGAFVHAVGRGDFCASFALELKPGGKTSPQQHLFEEVVYVMEGQGSTVVDLPDGRKHHFEWGPKSLFALPLNARYQHFNTSGQSRALLASTHNLPSVMNLFHNHDFVFNNSFVFPERFGRETYFDGQGDFTSIRPGSHLWETNFVHDLTQFELKEWEARGAGSSNIAFVLADGTMHAHMSEIPKGRYKKGHRHGDGMHVFAVNGSGYSLFWYKNEQEYKRVPWRHGVMYAPPHLMFHQHFNTADHPARYIAIGIGSRRYPFIRMRREAVLGSEVNVREGGMQIDYNDQRRDIHEIWLKEMRDAGTQNDMGRYIDESSYSS